MELDDALNFIGAYGRYQVAVYFTLAVFNNLPSIWHMSVMAFLGYTPDHHCKIPEGTSVNQSIPTKKVDGEWVLEKCSMFEYNNNTGVFGNNTVSCPAGWEYSQKEITTTIVTEWDLVCDRKVLPEASQMVFNFGVMFGAILFGFLSDKYGRKKIFIGALLAQAVVGTITAFSPNFYMFATVRFFVGALEQGVNITGFIMATELFPPKQRTLAAVAHEFFWAIGGVGIPLFGYLFMRWHAIQLAVSMPSLLGIALWWFIPESIVWLISKGRISEAEAILEKAAKWNKKSLPPNCLSSKDHKPLIQDGGKPEEESEHSGQDRTYTIIDLVRTPMLRKITICTSLLWALNTMVYYGLSYNTPNLDGNMYLNFFIGQMVEIPSVAVTMYLIYKVGRRWPLCLFHVFGGIVCIASPFVPAKTSGGMDLTWVSVTLAMLGKFSVNASFTIIFMYGPEIYPTVLRNTGAGIGSFSGRFGGIIYPYINYLSKLNTPVAKRLPLVVFGIISVVGGFIALPLPETRHNPLPETIEDVENYEEFCKKAKSQLNGNLIEMDATGEAGKGTHV